MGTLGISEADYSHGGSESESEHEFGFPLHDAAFQDDYDDIISILINEGHDVNGCNTNGETPLFVAAANGNEEALNVLLENMADPNLSNPKKITPLLKAVKCCHNNCVKSLLEQNASADLGDCTGWTPLHEACYNDLPSVVQYLIQIGLADPNILTDDDENSVTSLFTACQYGSKECAQLLLQYGADGELVTIHGDSPLHIACQEGHVDCAKLLIDHGVDVNRHNDSNISPLAVSCLLDQHDCAKLLISNGAEIEPKFGHTSLESPLHIAARHKGGTCISLLIDSSDVDVNMVCSGITPLFAAACVDNALACEVLLSAGADPNCYCKCYSSTVCLRYTPLMVTAEDGHVSSMVQLVSGGADVNRATFTSPLIMTVRSESFQCMNHLLSCDVDINFVDSLNRTALSTICSSICVIEQHIIHKPEYSVLIAMCRKMLQAGADISRLYQTEVCTDCVILMLSITFHPELMQLLLEFDGARIETKTICETTHRVNEHWKHLYDIVRSPRQLEHLCRLVIRQTLGYKRLQFIDDLPVPQNLKKYLRYEGVPVLTVRDGY